MAKSSVYSELLSTNIGLLFLKRRAPEELPENLEKNLFSLPNQKASDALIRYLYTVIDEDKYGRKLPWPLLDKKMENNFYTLVHRFSKEISDEYPEEKLPKLVKSFFLMPSGERYVQYLYKLTLIAMKNDLKLAGISMYPATRPKNEEGIMKLKTMNNISDQLLEDQKMRAGQSQMENKKRRKLLKSQLKTKQEILMQLKAELKKKTEKCSLPEYMKSLICCGHDHNVINEWSDLLKQRCERLERDAEVIKNIKWNISELNEATILKRNETLQKCASQFGDQQLLDGLPPDAFLNDLLRRAEATLSSQRLESPVDMSPCILELKQLASQFNTLLASVTHDSELIIDLYDENLTQIPQLEAALFSSEQLQAESMDEEGTGVEHSLINMLCKSTPPEVLRNLKISDLRCRLPLENDDTDTQNDSRTNSSNDEDVSTLTEVSTPENLDTNLLKPICFQRKCGGSTWKHALLLSTLKKKKQQEKQPESNSENRMCSLESFSDTPLSQHSKMSLYSVKSLHSFWGEEPANLKNISERILHEEDPFCDLSPRISSSTISDVSEIVKKEWDISGVSEISLGSGRTNHTVPGLSQSTSATLFLDTEEPLFNREQRRVGNITVRNRVSGQHTCGEDSLQTYQGLNSGNISQELDNFMQALINSNGSLMGASEVFENSASSGIHWNDQKELNRLLNVALSPVGNLPAELRNQALELQSSTPINSKLTSQPELDGHWLEDEKHVQHPAVVAAPFVSRIPRIKSFQATRMKNIRSTLLKE